jgi:predicted enzyme related to lactoylglutathione lyase
MEDKMSDIATAAPSATTETRQDPSSFEGMFIWYELVTRDPDAAIDFYTHVVGWTAADFPTPPKIGDFRYTILSAGERGVAGLMALTDEMKAEGGQPGWLGVINVADVDAATKRIAEAGGTIYKEPADIPTVGRFSVVADPGGAVFELLTPLPMEQEQPPLDRTATGNVGWHELYSSVGEKEAFDFYSRLLGWQTDTEMDIGEMGKYRIFAKDGTQLGGMMNKPDNMPAGAWTYYINVDAIDAAVERVKAKGGQIVTGPVEVPGGSRIIQGVDPQGVHFALVAPKR